MSLLKELLVHSVLRNKASNSSAAEINEQGKTE